MATRLDYNNGENVVPPDHFRISASSFEKFFSHTSQWYNENLLETSAGFTGSTASVLGTCVHFFSEDQHTNQTVDTEEIERYIIQECATDMEINSEIIQHQYPIMGQVLLNYLEENPSHEVEKFLYQEILPGIGIGGSVDSLAQLPDGTYKIRDWKTTSATLKPKSITYPHKLQLLVYAYLYTKAGYTISQIEICSINRHTPGKPGKPNAQGISKIGKAYPSEVTAIAESITVFDIQFIESLIKLVAQSVRAFIDTPDLRHVISQDLRNFGVGLPAKYQNVGKKQAITSAEDI